MEAKELLLEIYQITYERGWYWQKKENMSPWKVFSEKHFSDNSFFWLLFRVHKLCNAKYLYFSQNQNEWQPLIFEKIDHLDTRLQRFDDNKESDWVEAEALMHKITGKFVTFTKLQQIRKKELFIELIESLSGKEFPLLIKTSIS